MRNVPIAYLNAGRSYQLAAIQLIDIHTASAFPDLPRRQCLMIAAELYLKSFLLHDGMDNDELRNLGHDVGRAADTALVRGLEIEDQDRELLHMVSGNKTLLRDRYLELGSRGVPKIAPFRDLVEKLYWQVGHRLIARYPDYIVGNGKMAPRRNAQLPPSTYPKQGTTWTKK